MYVVEFEERALNVTKEFFYASGIVVFLYVHELSP